MNLTQFHYFKSIRFFVVMYFFIFPIANEAHSENVKDKFEKMRTGALYEHSSYHSFQRKGQVIGIDKKGYTIVFYPDWHLIETVKMVDGKREGESVVQDTEGGLWIERSYKLGKKTGACKYYGSQIPLRVIIEANFKNGKKHGIEKRFNEYGKLKETSEYDLGKLNWSETEYDAGKKYEERNFYYNNGQLSERKKYEITKTIIEEKSYALNGVLLREYSVDKKTGLRVERKYFYSGNIKEEVIYKKEGGVAKRKLFSEDGSWHREFNPEEELQAHKEHVNQVKKIYEKKETIIPIEADEYEVISAIVMQYVENSYLKELNLKTVLIANRSRSTYAYSDRRVSELPVYQLTGDNATLTDFINKNMKYYDFENKFKGSKTFDIIADNRLKKYDKKYFDFLFSRVGFNSDHTEAVVYMEQWGSGDLVLVKKKDQKWQLIKSIQMWIA